MRLVSYGQTKSGFKNKNSHNYSPCTIIFKKISIEPYASIYNSKIFYSYFFSCITLFDNVKNVIKNEHKT